MKKFYRHLLGWFLWRTCTREFDILQALKGKRVAVVGAADTAFHLENGDYIEKFDIIIRMNRAPYSWKPTHEKFIGKRIDFLFHSFYENEISGGGVINLKFFEQFQVQKIVNPNNNIPGKKAHLNFYKRHLKKINTLILNRSVSKIIHEQFKEKVPTVGFYALASALMAETEELYVTGFSFFQTPYGKNYRRDLENLAANKKHIIEQNLHEPNLELKLFKEFLRKSPSKRIILDDYLTKYQAGQS